MIERVDEPVEPRRLRELSERLLDAATLCAISTIDGDRAYVNTAYFAWAPDLTLVWLSHPDAQHSQNIRRNDSVAIAVFDSAQTWGKPDRGIQLFGTAREGEADAEPVYSARFAAYRAGDRAAYRLYAFRPSSVKLFDERELGAATFVTARVEADGSLAWERTELYRRS